ncbi:MAG: hypothetical protein ACOC6P_03815 [Candidatus Aminicenantaceae bacterium]
MNLKKALVLIFMFLFISLLLYAAPEKKKGKFEIGIHYGSWSVDLISGLFEDMMGNIMEESFKDAFLEEVQADNPDYEEKSYDQEINFDSSGQNYGFDIRWYPGRKRSFSLGLSVDKSTMRMNFDDTISTLILEDQITLDTATFKGNIERAQFEMNPLSFVLNFRWDIKTDWRIRPYITFGFGIASRTDFEQATISYSFYGTLEIPGEETETYEDEDSTTLKEIQEEAEGEDEEMWIPPVIPFIQLHIGVKGEITNNIHVLLDAGIWDGFLLRGGISYRF